MNVFGKSEKEAAKAEKVVVKPKVKEPTVDDFLVELRKRAKSLHALSYTYATSAKAVLLEDIEETFKEVTKSGTK